ncbi:MAG: winged helix-turn-helix domain-containing protein [Vicinamibacterales bacterium]
MPSGVVYAFGPFRVDASARRLTRDEVRIPVADRPLSVLIHLLERAGAVETKDAIIAAAWNDVAVTDNSLEQAVSTLRRLLGDRPDGGPYLETVPRQGYRFAGDVTRLAARTSDAGLEAMLAPHRRWIEGRAALETLATDQITIALAVLQQVVETVPDQASAHIGLANACVMRFETTRTDAEPDAASLTRAVAHAREACRLDPQSGESWATLGFVLDRTGQTLDALAASSRAVALEPDNWRHHLRLSSVAWGEQRLRAARRTLALLPGCPLAHWLAATVLVARQALGDAEREVVAGITNTRANPIGQPRFTGVALHWLLGLIAAARGEDDRARAELERELSFEATGHMYARECCAHTWYAIGALRLRGGDEAGADLAFGQALDRVPAHPMARVGRAAARGRLADLPTTLDLAGSNGAPAPGHRVVELAMAQAALLALTGRHREAAAAIAQALPRATAANAAWLLPLDPLIRVTVHPEVWAEVLSHLRAQAA